MDHYKYDKYQAIIFQKYLKTNKMISLKNKIWIQI